MAVSRPFGVTLVAIIAWITGAIQVISGVISLFASNLTAGITAILIGVITIAVSAGLFRGSNGARIIVTIVFAINIVAALAMAFGLGASIWAAIGASLLPAIGLVLLYSGRASTFFRS